MKYAWSGYAKDDTEAWAGLLPIGESNEHALTRIASIYRRGDGSYVGAYYYPHSTGNKQGNGVVQKTRRGVQRWLERELAKFWEPPTIVNPVS